MCSRCEPFSGPWQSRRAFVLATGAFAAVGGAALAPGGARAQVSVGQPSTLRNLVPADQLELSATRQYADLLRQAREQRALAGDGNAQLQRLRAIAQRIIPFTAQWNPRAAQWRWEINLIGSKQVNAFCMPGGKIAFFTGILDQLKLDENEQAMVMGHEMAHALREHARERLAKSTGTGVALSVGAQLLGLGQLGDLGARATTQLLTLKFSRDDETEADLVGLELAARAGFDPKASVSLWKKMASVARSQGGLGFLSTHPTGPDRIKVLEANVPKVERLYEAARKG